MIPQQLYDIFIGFEERSAEIYLNLAVKFAANRELSWFWVEMAMEEKQHAGMLHYCKDSRMFAADLPQTEEIQRLAAVFKALSTRVNAPDLTINEAFDVAITLESSEINEIYKNLTANVSGPWYVIRKKIELSAGNHFDKLRDAAAHFGISAEILSKLDNPAAAA